MSEIGVLERLWAWGIMALLFARLILMKRFCPAFFVTESFVLLGRIARAERRNSTVKN